MTCVELLNKNILKRNSYQKNVLSWLEKIAQDTLDFIIQFCVRNTNFLTRTKEFSTPNIDINFKHKNARL